MQGKHRSSQRTMVLLGVRGDAGDNLGAKTFEVAVEPVVANVVTPVEAHYLQALRSHCDRAGPVSLQRPFNRKSAYQYLGRWLLSCPSEE